MQNNNNISQAERQSRDFNLRHIGDFNLRPCRDLISRSIHKKFRKKLWTPFINAIKQYKLISEGDKIAVCISGGKDSMLMAKLMQSLQRYSDFPFEVVYLSMNPGYNELNLNQIKYNAELLQIPLIIFETDIFQVTDYMTAKQSSQSGVRTLNSASGERTLNKPCYLCARMRRGHLYSKAQELGCNKIALGHHLNDVIETTLLSMFYGAQMQCMLPRLHSTNFSGMELIRPLYCVREDDIIAWRDFNNLKFIQCACRFTANIESGAVDSKRNEVKQLIKNLRKINPDIEHNIFSAVHSVNIDTFPAWKQNGERHSFLDNFL